VSERKDYPRFCGAKVIQVVEVEVNEGNGVDVPIRRVTYYLSLDGVVLARHDPMAPERAT
jgi:hypothetical protein